MNDRNEEAGAKKGIDDPLTEKVIGCAIGPGFLENIYHKGLAHEMNKAHPQYVGEARIQVVYDGVVLGDHIADFLIEGKLVLELKAVEALTKTHEIQLVNYLNATRCDVGLLLNFGSSKVQMKRKFREFHRVSSLSSHPVPHVDLV